TAAAGDGAGAAGGDILPVPLDVDAEEAATASIAACSATAAGAAGAVTQDSRQPARDVIVVVAPASSSLRSLSLRPRSASANFFRRSAFFAQSPTFLAPPPPPPPLLPELALPLPEEPTLPCLDAALPEQAAPPVGCNQRVSRLLLPPSTDP
ncbi:unnamed protein product, partial [Ectocarpus fasciculatus]